MISKQFSIAVVVSDAKRSAEWFKEKIGLMPSFEGHWVTVRARGSNWRIHLCQTENYGVEPGNTGIAFYCENIEKEVRRLKGRGAEFSKDLTEAKWGKYAMIRDPDGNEYWLIEGKP